MVPCLIVSISLPALSEDPDSALLRRAQKLASTDFAESIECYETYLKRHPDSDVANMNLADVFAQAGRYKDALARYSRVSVKFANSERNHIRCGVMGCRIILGEKEKFSKEIDQMLTTAPMPHLGASYNFLAVCLHDAGDLARAQKVFDWALKTSQGRLKLLLVTSQAHYLSVDGNPKRAVRLVQTAYPNSREDGVIKLKCATFLRARETSALLALVDRELPRASGENRMKLLKFKTDALIDSGRVSEALAPIRLCVSEFPNDLDGLERAASIFLKVGLTREALPVFERISTVAQDPAVRIGARVSVLNVKGQFQAAKKLIAEEVERDPKNTSLMPLQIENLMRLDQLDEALVEINRVLAEDPDNERFRSFRATVLGRMDRYDGAAQDFEYLSKRHPVDSSLKLNLMDTYHNLSDFQRMRQIAPEYMKLLANNPTKSELVAAADLMDACGCEKDAVILYNRALTGDNKKIQTDANPQLMRKLARLYARRKEYDKAATTFEEVIAVEDSRDDRFQLLEVYDLAGKLDKAVALSRRLLVGSTRREQRILFNKQASLYRRLDRPDDAAMAEIEASRLGQ